MGDEENQEMGDEKLPGIKSPPAIEANTAPALHDDIEEPPVPFDIKPAVPKVAETSNGGQEKEKASAKNDLKMSMRNSSSIPSKPGAYQSNRLDNGEISKRSASKAIKNSRTAMPSSSMTGDSASLPSEPGATNKKAFMRNPSTAPGAYSATSDAVSSVNQSSSANSASISNSEISEPAFLDEPYDKKPGALASNTVPRIKQSMGGYSASVSPYHNNGVGESAFSNQPTIHEEEALHGDRAAASGLSNPGAYQSESHSASKKSILSVGSHNVDSAPSLATSSQEFGGEGYEVYTPERGSMQMEPTPMATDEAFNKEKVWTRPRLIMLFILLTLVGVAIGLGIALSQKNNNKSGDITNPADTEENIPASVTTTAPTVTPTTMQPTADISSCIAADEAYIPSEHFVSIRLDLVNNGVATDDAEFDVPFSPQRRALCWIADADNFGKGRSFSFLAQRYILAVFYHSVYAGGVELNNWVHYNTDECLWEGITCEPVEGGNVISLELPIKKLEGELPKELGGLEYLKTLDLSGNKIKGIISQYILNLGSLETLILRSNKLEGNLPEDIDQLAELKELNLNSNGSLNGTIPTKLGNLQNLERLILNFNSFSGMIPFQLGNLANAGLIDLSDNLFEGPIPIELSTLPKLEALLLSGNDLNSTIPEEFGRMPKLIKLAVQDTELSGTIDVDNDICTIQEFFADCKELDIKCVPNRAECPDDTHPP